MLIRINGQSREVPAGITVSELLSQLRVSPERVAVELNLSILDRSDFSNARLGEGDFLEIIGFVGGGASE
jgi:thiamine biosynthesis protein ThiS